MPHEALPYLDDYQANVQKELQKVWDDEAKIFNTQNQALRAGINCPFPLRTKEMCENCGESTCVKAWKEQNELWPENEESPASAANTTNMHRAATASPAASGLQNTPECQRLTRPASGSSQDLFAMLARQREDEEAAA